MRIRIFESNKGDCLLLTSRDGKNILVDGGQVGRGKDAYSPNVAPALGRMRRDGGKLDLVCVSHIDQDHIGGILKMVDDEFAWRVYEYQRGQGLRGNRPANPRPPEIEEIWHNAFHLTIRANRRRITDAIAAAAFESLALGDELDHHGENFFDYLSTSKKEAAQVSRRINSEQLDIPLNEAFGGKLVMHRPRQSPLRLGGFKISVVGPTGKQLADLRKEWDEWLRSRSGRKQRRQVREQGRDDEELLGNGQLDEFLAASLGRPVRGGSRSSVTRANIASIVMYVEEGNQNILLTGDARDDHVLEDLIGGGIADSSGSVHLNVLKIQHHGSENNFSRDFAKKVTADHYLFCGNGANTNPEKQVVEAVIDSRLGSRRRRSENPQVGNRFKLWFSASASTYGANSSHMREVEAMVRRRARSSGGQMRYSFSQGSSISFSP